MAQPAILFDGVWKKFKRGERHDSLRDLIPAISSRLWRRPPQETLRLDEFWVLKDVSFQVQPGEALGIIGQNGAGKSTTLKLLTKILRPTLGIAKVHGRVGALIEIAAGFHPDLTGRENVFLQGAIMGMSKLDIRQRFDAIVDFSGLSSFIDTPVKRYSSGMNARLGFSIAANLEPDVLLIDEVLAVGDFTFQQKCYERLQEFRRRGTAIAFVSHNMQAVASLCERALLLRPDQPPRLDHVAVVTGLYTKGGELPADPRAKVISAVLVQASDRSLPPSVSPGEPLVLKATAEILKDLPRAGIVFQVVRSDGLVMFAGMSTLDGESELDLHAGESIVFEISFAANMLRGIYTVNVQLVDSNRTWPAVVLNGLGSFVVSETNRAAGCAELFPRYTVDIIRRHPAQTV